MTSHLPKLLSTWLAVQLTGNYELFGDKSKDESKGERYCFLLLTGWGGVVGGGRGHSV